MKLQTEQENFWRGKFGDDYIERNKGEKILASKVYWLSKILTSTGKVNSFLELGANIGLNLAAIKILQPDAHLSAVEINHKAAEQCRKIENVEVFEESILNFSCSKQWDFTFSFGVLIHINPDYLDKAYRTLYECSKRYICISEYYNPVPVEVSYRGNEKKLFKRDFAGEIMDKYSDLRLVDYGFMYHRDSKFPGDDCNWFLFEKR